MRRRPKFNPYPSSNPNPSQILAQTKTPNLASANHLSGARAGVSLRASDITERERKGYCLGLRLGLELSILSMKNKQVIRSSANFAPLEG